MEAAENTGPVIKWREGIGIGRGPVSWGGSPGERSRANLNPS